MTVMKRNRGVVFTDRLFDLCNRLRPLKFGAVGKISSAMERREYTAGIQRESQCRVSTTIATVAKMHNIRLTYKSLNSVIATNNDNFVYYTYDFILSCNVVYKGRKYLIAKYLLRLFESTKMIVYTILKVHF